MQEQELSCKEVAVDTNQECLVPGVQMPQVMRDFLTRVLIAVTIKGPRMPRDLEGGILSPTISVDPHKAVTSLHPTILQLRRATEA